MTSSSKNTGNESVSDIDPGGTRKTQDKKSGTAEKHVEHKVQSGDRNDMTKSDHTPGS